ncbi:MAG: hypothetical protein ACRDJX_01250 [Solirubrobacteraceae bacterium]
MWLNSLGRAAAPVGTRRARSAAELNLAPALLDDVLDRDDRATPAPLLVGEQAG